MVGCLQAVANPLILKSLALIGKSWIINTENLPKFQFTGKLLRQKFVNWQILEKSSGNFTKYLIAGSSARPFYWKNNPIFIRNLNFGAMS